MNNINKKSLIIIASFLVAVFAGIGFIFYLQSLKTVYFDIKKPVTVAVYKVDAQDKTEVATLNKSGDVKLQPGDYFVVPTSDQYDSTDIEFTVKDAMTVTIDPQYSEAYREEIRAAEQPAITRAITAAYPLIVSDFVLGEGEIYQDGSWYGTTFTQKTAHPSIQGDVYRTVLKKEKGGWVIKAKPALILSAKEYPDIPLSVLQSVNQKK